MVMWAPDAALENLGDVQSVEWAMAELGMSRSGVKKAIHEGRIVGKKLSDRVYVVSKASVQEKKGVRK